MTSVKFQLTHNPTLDISESYVSVIGSSLVKNEVTTNQRLDLVLGKSKLSNRKQISRIAEPSCQLNGNKFTLRVLSKKCFELVFSYEVFYKVESFLLDINMFVVWFVVFALVTRGTENVFQSLFRW